MLSMPMPSCRPSGARRAGWGHRHHRDDEPGALEPFPRDRRPDLGSDPVGIFRGSEAGPVGELCKSDTSLGTTLPLNLPSKFVFSNLRALARGTHAVSTAVEETIFRLQSCLGFSRYAAHSGYMKLVIQTQLLPDAEQAAKLRTVIERFNAAANHAAGVAFEHRTANLFELRGSVTRRFASGSACPRKWLNWRSRPPATPIAGTRRSVPGSASMHAVAYDQRIMSFKSIDRVSLLTLEGRVVVPFILGSYHAKGSRPQGTV